ALTHPDFISAATGRFERNPTSIRRELRTAFHSCGMYEPVGCACRNQRIEFPSPDVDIRRLARICQSVPLNRRFDSFLTELQSFWFPPSTGHLPKPAGICQPPCLRENNVASVGRPR